MSRVKRGVVSKRKHHKIFELTKGYRMTKRRLIKVATEASLHAGEYAFAGRKNKKRDFKRLWIVRINGALETLGLSYSQFMAKLKKAKIELDRKILAELVISDFPTFKLIVDKVKNI